jgi:N6-L-threonylcarbamoyladenine synthase
LPYPGGPHIEEAAKNGDPMKYDFPRPMKHSDDLNLSFSGLKTAVLYATKDLNINDERSNISASFQEAVIDVLSTKIKKAMKQTGNKTLVMAGGVAANKKIRAALDMLEEKEGFKVFYPSIKHCTDNAAMIAYLGSLKTESKNIYNSNVRARWPVSEI